MVISESKQLSTNEIIEMGATFIADSIHTAKTGLCIYDDYFEVFMKDFKKAFKEKAAEMLDQKPRLTLTIGPSINTDNGGIYSNDMITILTHIERTLQQKCYFYYGAMVVLEQKEYFSSWQPQ